MRRVGLFGAYHYGNFGDDLMAVLFGRGIRDLGLHCSVTGLAPEIAEEAGCELESNWAVFLRDSDTFVIGGGGMFLQRANPKRTTMFESRLLDLLDHARNRKKPVFCFSVGGDSTEEPKLTWGQTRLLQESQFISFRNQSDEVLMKLRDGESDRAEDIVWSAGKMLDLRLDTANINGVGIDLIGGTRNDRFRRRILGGMLRIRGDAVTAYSPWHTSKRRKPIRKSEVGYNTIHQVMESLRNHRLVFGSRLHFGMCAWSLGVPGALFRPLPKAVIAWSEAGLHDYVCHNLREVHALAKRHRSNGFRLPETVTARLNSKASDAQRHIQLLQSCLAAVE